MRAGIFAALFALAATAQAQTVEELQRRLKERDAKIQELSAALEGKSGPEDEELNRALERTLVQQGAMVLPAADVSVVSGQVGALPTDGGLRGLSQCRAQPCGPRSGGAAEPLATRGVVARADPGPRRQLPGRGEHRHAPAGLRRHSRRGSGSAGPWRPTWPLIHVP